MEWSIQLVHLRSVSGGWKMDTTTLQYLLFLYGIDMRAWAWIRHFESWDTGSPGTPDEWLLIEIELSDGRGRELLSNLADHGFGGHVVVLAPADYELPEVAGLTVDRIDNAIPDPTGEVARVIAEKVTGQKLPTLREAMEVWIAWQAGQRPCDVVSRSLMP